jgi:hypothetical protein
MAAFHNLQDDMETVPWSDVVRKIMAAQKRLRCCHVCTFSGLTLALYLPPLLPFPGVTSVHFLMPIAKAATRPFGISGNQRLTDLLFSPSRRFCRVKVDVNEHDIANRIMRRDNFMIAMVMKVRM